jgi:opacity protein-like surface antigen
MRIQFRHLAAAGAVAAILGAPAAAADEPNPASTNWAGVFGGAYVRAVRSALRGEQQYAITSDVTRQGWGRD